MQYNSGKEFQPDAPIFLQDEIAQSTDGPPRFRQQAGPGSRAELRRISISDYVRTVTVAQALREVASAQDQTIQLSPDEQLAFWNALQTPVKLTAAQKRLGALMQARP